MTDLLEITSGRMVVRDTDGVIAFDSDERPFLPLTTTISGSVTISERSSSANSTTITSYADENNPIFLASCPSACTVVRGGFYVSTAGSSFGDVGVGIGWYNASGSYVHAAENRVMCAYTFYASGGGVYLNERSVVVSRKPTSGTRTVTIFAVTLTYKLIAGVFL